MNLVQGVGKLAERWAYSIGDYLVSLPALQALRAAYPAAELVLLGGRLAGRGRPRCGHREHRLTLPRGMTGPCPCRQLRDRWVCPVWVDTAVVTRPAF